MKYKTLEVSGRVHVVKPIPSRSQGMSDPDYKGTGMALCAILQPGQTLENWIAESNKRKSK